jgi:hypothetical protein
MIIIARSYGQLGNRLFLYAHLIAAARQYGVQLANPCFADYASLFSATADDLWCRYPRVATGPAPSIGQRKAAARLVYAAARGLGGVGMNRYPFHVLRLRGEQACDLGSEEFANLARGRRPILALGWLFRSEPLLRAHAGAVRDHFRIGSRHQVNVDRAIETLRADADLVVGVHIRQGDYANYLGGKYFYSAAQYAAAMRRVVEQLPGQRVAFLVCSNAGLDFREFRGLNAYPGPGHLVEDLYAFANSDLLMGPPSTYTGWASFYGDVPLAIMHSADAPIDVGRTLGRRAA